MKCNVYQFTTHTGKRLLYLQTIQLTEAYNLLTERDPTWARLENKDRVIAILRLNGFEVEDRT